MGRPLAPHGTEAAYKRHLRHKESPCDACAEAHRALQRAKRDAVAAPRLPKVSDAESDDDLVLIRSVLRKALRDTAASDPSKVAPIAKELRAVVEAMSPSVDPPKELTLDEQLAEARAARAARAQAANSAAVSGGKSA